MPRKPNTAVVAVRLPTTAIDELERRAAEMGIKRSVLLRSVILTGLGEKPRMAAIQEVFWQVKPIMHRVVAYATNEVYKALPELIDKELASDIGEEPEPNEPAPKSEGEPW